MYRSRDFEEGMALFVLRFSGERKEERRRRREKRARATGAEQIGSLLIARVYLPSIGR